MCWNDCIIFYKMKCTLTNMDFFVLLWWIYRLLFLITKYNTFSWLAKNAHVNFTLKICVIFCLISGASCKLKTALIKKMKIFETLKKCYSQNVEINQKGSKECVSWTFAYVQKTRWCEQVLRLRLKVYYLCLFTMNTFYAHYGDIKK